MTNPLAASAQYLTFKLGDELFAIDVAQVREILELSLVTRVPSAPAYMRGVVNVRGKATPVVDLRLKFGLPPVADTLDKRIVVMELSLDGENTVVGGLADSVHEVIEIETSQIEPPPRLAMRWRSELIKGISRRGEQFIIILDLDAVFSSDEVALIEAHQRSEVTAA
jgi:purine-binding chemotaxis protein CheW